LSEEDIATDSELLDHHLVESGDNWISWFTHQQEQLHFLLSVFGILSSKVNWDKVYTAVVAHSHLIIAFYLYVDRAFAASSGKQLFYAGV
jgi:hypothetical protein